MTRDAKLTAINCTSCGAGLDILGGGRVQVHICPYCGSELDAQDNYKVIQQYSDLDRPQTPLKIGMSGEIKGVTYTVIGVLEQREAWGHQIWTWVDHQIYSPTHGYAWLTWEDGHFTFTRRARVKVWISEHMVERAETPPIEHAFGKRFRYYDTSIHRITFAEGEFTWSPRIGNSATTINALASDEMLSFTKSGSEREVERTVYLDRDMVAESFGATLPGPAKGIHPVQPFTPGPNYRFLQICGGAFAALAFVVALILSGRSGTEVLRYSQFAAHQLPQTIELNIPEGPGLTEIRLAGDTHNAWAVLGIELEGPDGTPLFEAGRAVEYYEGRDSDGGWREGDNRASLRFRPETPGIHRLTLSLEESQTWSDRSATGIPRQLGLVGVSASAGQSSSFWLVILGIGFAATAILQTARGALHHARRWRGSDWTDED